MTAMELRAAYERGELAPERVVKSYLDRVRVGTVYLEKTEDLAWPTPEGPLTGIPISVKDNFDQKGRVTAGGSVVLRERPPAAQDATAIARLKAAGAALLGRTNMTELAYSGLGLNPHFGTPENPNDPSRVPGGSSSGAATSVRADLAVAAIGTDTGGSVRIPAAFQGLVGFKPTNGLIPTSGVLPLSPTLDTVGPITRDLEDAWLLLSVLAGWPLRPFPKAEGPYRLLLPQTVVTEDLDPEVELVLEAVVTRVMAAGHRVERAPVPEFLEILELYRQHGSLAEHEAYRLYRDLVERRGEAVDPRVASRVVRGGRWSEADRSRVRAAYERLPRRFWAKYGAYDAIITPTVPVRPPSIADLASDQAYFRTNARVLRNTMLFNFLQGPAVSLPASPMIGVMLAAPPGRDAALFAVARAVMAA